ncbi:MAG: carbohydrate porin [Alphaproteobacteria bacterium]|nr:MAG: carbohydrate porin [Alphaproteobacteria bacterium]
MKHGQIREASLGRLARRCLFGVLIATPSVCLGMPSSAQAQAVASEEDNVDIEPIVVEAGYTGEIIGNTRGGLRRAARYMDNLDLTLSVASEAFGYEGGTFFGYILYNNDSTFSGPVVGDLQVVSNIDNESNVRLFEAWYEQRLLDGRASAKLGLFDLNSEFDAIETSGLFILSSHGIGAEFSQTGLNGPSIFPITSAGVRLDYKFAAPLTFRLAAFDAVPGTRNKPRKTAIHLSKGEGALIVAEADTHPLPDLRLVLGAWTYTTKFESVEANFDLPDVEMRADNHGIYAFAEGPLYREPDGGPGRLDAWVRFGIADTSVNQIRSYLGSGLVYTGLLPGRPEDQLGLAVALARNGGRFLRAARAAGMPEDKRETNIELTYRAPLADWLTVQPDAQYIVNPGTHPDLRDAFVIGLRFEFGFTL